MVTPFQMALGMIGFLQLAPTRKGTGVVTPAPRWLASAKPDQAALAAAARRRIVAPTRPRQTISIAHLDGSGTPVTTWDPVNAVS